MVPKDKNYKHGRKSSKGSHSLNPFMPSVLFYLNLKNKSMFSRRCVRVCLIITMFYRSEQQILCCGDVLVGLHRICALLENTEQILVKIPRKLRKHKARFSQSTKRSDKEYTVTFDTTDEQTKD